MRQPKILAEGKTKIIYEVPGEPDMVEFEAKEDVTAYDDPAFTKLMKMKPVYATTTACKMSSFSHDAGLSIAHLEQTSPTRWRTQKCKMIPLEVIARRLAVGKGGYVARHPELQEQSKERPYRFPKLIIEFFLKTTHGGYTNCQGERVELGLDFKKGEEDPLIENPHAEVWQLLHPRQPGVKLGQVRADSVINQPIYDEGKIVQIQEMDETLRKEFLLYEKVWAMLGFWYADVKEEFGYTALGRIARADVVDNDSWRLLNQLLEDFSKQAHRDGKPIEEVEMKYKIVTSLLEQFTVPEQVLVSWRGSERDDWPSSIPDFEYIPGIIEERVTLSGHKQTAACLRKLNELQGKYHSGVILANIGLSNGLGPILAAHSTWPVIGIPATAEDFPNDIWSSLRLPSQVPMVTCLGKNAVNAALNILAQQNPYLYMKQQYAVEELDD